jgi:hypothetical protein|tara:strand:+ start:631 stop:1140 length:510 start_codon:yes stop_codon:yes gene_type:complete
MRKQIGSLILISTLVSGCGGPVAMVSSSAGFMASNDIYVKAYNGVDFMTTLATDKDIKTHIYETAKNTIELGKGIKIYNKKYYSGNLTGEKAAVTEVKEEVLVSSVTTEPKVEKIEKKQTMAFTLCYLSFFLALAIGSFVFVSTYGLVSLSKTKRTRKIKRKNKKGRRK